MRYRRKEGSLGRCAWRGEKMAVQGSGWAIFVHVEYTNNSLIG